MTITLHDLRSELGRQARVYCRLMLRKSEQGWKLQALMAHAPAASLPLFSYDYGHIAFIGGTIKGSRLASWLLKLKGGMGHFRFVIPKLHDNVNSHRYPSHVRGDIWLSIPQPFSLHTISIMESDQRPNDYSPLVKDGCPSFQNISAAAASLIYGEPASSRQLEPNEIHIRIVHREAWMEQVHLHPTAASITVEGTNVAGTRIEVKAEPEPYVERRLRKAGARRFSFKRGLPERLWIMLSRNDRWLDYRDLNLRGNRTSSEGDVVIEPVDDCAQIEGLISRGERETVEFKQEVSNDKSAGFLRTVAAFANGSGGVIIFGVTDDTSVKGIGGDVRREKERIANLIHDVVVPHPRFRIEGCKIRGRQVLALFIEEGDSPPYGLDALKPRFFIRRGSTTRHADQAEVRVLAQKGQTDSVLPYLAM